MTINKLSVSVKIQVHTVRRALLIVHVIHPSHLKSKQEY